VLTALIEEGHDHIDAAGFAADRQDGALQILVMVVRAHVVDQAVHFVGAGKVHDIDQDEQVVAADGVADDRFAFAGGEAQGADRDAVIMTDEAGVRRAQVGYLFQVFGAPASEVVIDAVGKDRAAGQGDDADRPDWGHHVVAVLVVNIVAEIVCIAGLQHQVSCLSSLGVILRL